MMVAVIIIIFVTLSETLRGGSEMGRRRGEKNPRKKAVKIFPTPSHVGARRRLLLKI